jgi:hypothetical protein
MGPRVEPSNQGVAMITKRTFSTIAALFAGVVVATTASAASAPNNAALLIRHQIQGCHTWSLNGGTFKSSQTTVLARRGMVTIIDNDMMPHKLVQTSGPAVRYIGSPSMSHMSASVKVVFPKTGVYHFTTKPGEDYMPVKTTGEDHVLRLTVTVP